MFRFKVFITIFLFSSFLFLTSIVKNQTRELEKNIYNLNKIVLQKKLELGESQLDFYYLTSPMMIEKRINDFTNTNYKPMEYSNIFFDLQSFSNINKKFVNQKNNNEKKIRKK